jgi:hypothetical protein
MDSASGLCVYNYYYNVILWVPNSVDSKKLEKKLSTFFATVGMLYDPCTIFQYLLTLRGVEDEYRCTPGTA